MTEDYNFEPFLIDFFRIEQLKRLKSVQFRELPQQLWLKELLNLYKDKAPRILGTTCINFS